MQCMDELVQELLVICLPRKRLLQESEILQKLPCGFKLQHMFLHKEGAMLLQLVFCGYHTTGCRSFVTEEMFSYRLSFGAQCLSTEIV